MGLRPRPLSLQLRASPAERALGPAGVGEAVDGALDDGGWGLPPWLPRCLPPLRHSTVRTESPWGTGRPGSPDRGGRTVRVLPLGLYGQQKRHVVNAGGGGRPAPQQPPSSRQREHERGEGPPRGGGLRASGGPHGGQGRGWAGPPGPLPRSPAGPMCAEPPAALTPHPQALRGICLHSLGRFRSVNIFALPGLSLRISTNTPPASPSCGLVLTSPSWPSSLPPGCCCCPASLCGPPERPRDEMVRAAGPHRSPCGPLPSRAVRGAQLIPAGSGPCRPGENPGSVWPPLPVLQRGEGAPWGVRLGARPQGLQLPGRVWGRGSLCPSLAPVPPAAPDC